MAIFVRNHIFYATKKRLPIIPYITYTCVYHTIPHVQIVVIYN
jgi:hypothetical protein